MPAKKPTKKVAVKVEKKAPQKPKVESLESQVARIGAQVETLIRRKGPVHLTDAQREILEKLPQMIEGLSSQLEQIGKDVKSKEPPRLAGADKELLGELQAEMQSVHKEVHALKQVLEEMKSGIEQAAPKPSAPEEQPKQEEEPKAG